VTLFLWVKAVHVIGVIAWFAGIFYLPRLFVYHAATTDTSGRARFEMMEAKLYRIIMLPAMLIAVGFGIWSLALTWQAWGGQVWLWAKVALVVVLVGYHHYCGVVIRRFASGDTPHSERFFRIFNELPALLLILIVILVVVKPFS
jgi:putative membrane protein